MAMSDYWACDVCGCKTFYDANLDYDLYSEGESAGYLQREDGRVLPRGSGDVQVICPECAKTHEIIVRKK